MTKNTKNPTETLAQRVRRLRKLRGWTTAHLAVYSSVSVATVTHLEQGRELTLTNLTKIAKALDLTLAELLAGVIEP